MSVTGGGLVAVDGLLTPVAGAALLAAIDAWSAPRPDADGERDTREPAQRRHDALQRLCETVLAADGVLPSTHGTAYRVVVTVPVGRLLGEPAGPALLPTGQPVPDRRLQQLLCHAEVVPVALDRRDLPIDVGDTQYPFTPRQRAALALEHGHCTYGTCTAPAAWCDAHHVTPFSRGGRTDLSNGTLLCGRHHRWVHATGGSGPPSRSRAEAVARQAITHLATRLSRAA
ncbi:hypothetical protein GCM10025868_10890 [Angustibacter aerolatus]|uniref:HNH nuclease domain-containing protein n=1 Tax=Angustibacter aerolatus TaxID=1162965 RepID=A0ABQ6JEJ2_9ACTN|nr:hypothetical protein GCM10025868_10890 [Angustibacter aerolatus]